MLIEQLEKLVLFLKAQGITKGLSEFHCYPFNPPESSIVCHFKNRKSISWFQDSYKEWDGRANGSFDPFTLLDLEKFLDAFLRYKGESVGIYAIYVWKNQMSCILWDFPEGAKRRTQLFWDEETDTWTEES